MTIPSSTGKPDLVLWTGPVWAGNLSKVQWSVDTEVLALPCEGSDNCAGILTSLPSTGRLEALLASRGKRADQYGAIMLGSFSAGHGMSNLLLSDPASRDRIAAFGAFDSYYTGVYSSVKKGYRAFAEQAVSEGKFMWTSCSSNPDRQWLSCEDSIKSLLDEIGPQDSDLPGDLAEYLKPAKYVVSKYGCFHAAYGTAYKHAEHATIVAPAVFEHWLSPMVHGAPSSGLLKKAGMVIGAAAAAIAAWKLGKWASRRRA